MSRFNVIPQFSVVAIEWTNGISVTRVRIPLLTSKEIMTKKINKSKILQYFIQTAFKVGFTCYTSLLRDISKCLAASRGEQLDVLREPFFMFVHNASRKMLHHLLKLADKRGVWVG